MEIDYSCTDVHRILDHTDGGEVGGLDLVFARTGIPVRSFIEHLIAGGTVDDFADLSDVPREQLARFLAATLEPLNYALQKGW
jgi:hypothetical protein